MNEAGNKADEIALALEEAIVSGQLAPGTVLRQEQLSERYQDPLLQERYPKARVILISGSIFEDKRPHPDERGTDAYLEKSEVPERLHATILALAAETTAAPPSRTNA